MRKRNSASLAKGFAYAILFLALPVAVIVEVVGSTPVAYRTLASAAMACPSFMCLLWRFNFSPQLRVGEEGLIVQNPYRTTRVPWSQISEIGWQKSLASHRLRILTSEGVIHPYAFGKVSWGAEARMQFLADIEALKGARSVKIVNQIQHKRVSVLPEVCAATFFVICLIVVLARQ
ncbi:PH domain-containing protein [Streptomyces sp. NPDC051563]|uniref:PH domain-containing protein n=1 Tax=Streptomyces sp. NPDC051563 TaxID=3365659 RepID=UPI00379A92AB